MIFLLQLFAVGEAGARFSHPQSPVKRLPWNRHGYHDLESPAAPKAEEIPTTSVADVVEEEQLLVASRLSRSNF